MSDFRNLSSGYSVAPQIAVEDIAAAKAAGFSMVVNNRPDGEDPSAPQGGDIADACAAEGLAYAAIPVGHAGFSHPQLDSLDTLLADTTGPILAYCRSGTRSTHLWALTRARAGDDLDGLCNAASAAGYDLSGLRPMMEALAGKA
ncbi:MAG: TIGR01244 family sulfur transferase [Sphingopyxis sp.]|uniref:TIGR01244 family sulfur transferase n=1 Tax=Sphingopyxis sp. TaxID=1908224 RepID=UPI002ABC88B1|nr:TIGR01244 family sulfur transferase [Sphingopyxis sp.]MDZ3832167.1 TIGR01244 family sulfur transferase [Sphingopyxis sp.]